jgi:hypothetical protein
MRLPLPSSRRPLLSYGPLVVVLPGGAFVCIVGGVRGAINTGRVVGGLAFALAGLLLAIAIMMFVRLPLHATDETAKPEHTP